MKRHAKNFLLLFMSLIISLFIVEITIRMFFPFINMRLNQQTILLKENPDFSYYEKNYQFKGGDLGYIHSTDIAGYNRLASLGPDPENIAEKTIRILALGDSVIDPTHPCGSNGKAYTHKLENLLNKEHSKVCIFNAGCTGYNCLQEYAYLEQFGLSHNPDIVLLNFVNDDFFSSWEHEISEERIVISEYVSRYIPIVFDFGQYWRIVCCSETFKLFLRSMGRFFDPGETRFARYKPDYERNKNCLNRIHKLCQIQGIRLIVVHFPYLLDFKNYRTGIFFHLHETVSAFCQENKIPCIQLLDHYERFSPSELKYLENDSCHPNKKGHDIAAQVVSSMIQSQITGDLNTGD